MKVLMLTPYLPYPDSSGGQIRTQNLLKHLHKKNDITLISLIKDKSENKYKKHLLKYCKKVITLERSKSPWTLRNILETGFSLKPFLIVRNSVHGAQAIVRKELEEGDYDLIHAETFYVMPSIPETKIPIILVDQTIEYLVYQHYVDQTAHPLIKPLLNIDVAKLKYWEKYYWKKANQVVAVSKDDQIEMKKLVPQMDVKIVPNGVNLSLFRKKTKWSSKNPIVLQISNFKWLQNVEAAKMLLTKVFPLVKKKLPQAILQIVGQHIPDDIKSFANDYTLIKDVPEEDVKSLVDAWHDADVFASTIKGPGGTRLKNLAAMASQLPIVSTRVGIQGLGVKDKIHVLIGDTPKDLSDKIISVFKNPQLAQKLGTNSRKLVEEKFDYQSISEILNDIYQKLGKK